ncbi:hypothetical protein [Streptomyces pyxinae]|uniref:hypothetical protein n=1 Tax=Streptomyces pyxinae TaxID=2970734 RepID=UPI003D16D7CF
MDEGRAGDTGARAAGGADDAGDSLFVLTALLLTPARFPAVLGDDFPEVCALLGLEPRADGYGLVLGQDGNGARWTVAVDDVSLVAGAIAAWDCGMAHDLSPDDRSVVTALPGWPLELTVAAPGVPEPHDPEPLPGDPPPLRPPDVSAWGPAQRRMGADQVETGWSSWREQAGVGDAGGPAGPAGMGGAEDTGDTEDAEDTGSAEEAGGTGVTRRGPGSGTGGHPGVRRVLEAARAYLTDAPPPGRIRSGFAPGNARTLRVDGPGWSLVARTDDMAFILLDEEPRGVLPAGRGPGLAVLLEALDAIAARPA